MTFALSSRGPPPSGVANHVKFLQKVLWLFPVPLLIVEKTPHLGEVNLLAEDLRVLAGVRTTGSLSVRVAYASGSGRPSRPGLVWTPA